MAPDSLLKHRTFMHFWTGQMASSLAIQMRAVGIGWQIDAYNFV